MRGPTAMHSTPSTSDRLPACPLAEGQIRDLVAISRQPLGEVAIPPLATADGVREQTVVDQADAHPRTRRLPDRALRSLAAGATFGRGTRSISREAAFSSPAAHEYDRAREFPRPPIGSRGPLPRGLSRDPVPQRGRDDRAMRAQRARGAERERARRRGDRRRQRLRGRQRRARRARPGRRSCTSPNAATEAPTWRASRPPAAATS